jgi:hypothetical protein
MKQLLFVSLIVLSTQLFAQDKIPVGIILPLKLNSSLCSNKARADEQISARLMQDVPLPGGRKIHAGTKVIGHIVSARPAVNGMMADLSLRFDTLELGKRRVAMLTNLRALASMMDVEDAQVPPEGPDRGTPWVWTTRNLIGGEVAYGEGPVTRGTDIVGQALASGVLIRVEPNAALGCRGEVAGSVQPQALWVFSSDACGLYDLPNVTLAHSGRTDPVGLIKLLCDKGNVKVRAGSGVLLRVIAAGQ